jgi:hypothetical protein
MTVNTCRRLSEVRLVWPLGTCGENFTRRQNSIFKLPKTFQNAIKLFAEGTFLSKDPQMKIHSQRIFGHIRHEKIAFPHVSSKPNTRACG